MRHFRMKLQGIKSFAFIRHNGNRGIVRMRHRNKINREFLYPVAVAHPDNGFFRYIPENLQLLINDKFGPAVLSFMRLCNLASKHMRHKLHTVADSENRHAELEYFHVRYRRRWIVYT